MKRFSGQTTHGFVIIICIIGMILLALYTISTQTEVEPEIEFEDALISCSAGKERLCDEAVIQFSRKDDEVSLIRADILLKQYYRATHKVLKVYKPD